MTNRPEVQTTKAMQRTIDELHNALWLALKCSGGEIAVTPAELAEWGRPAGTVEWLTDQSNGTKIIRLVEQAP